MSRTRLSLAAALLLLAAYVGVRALLRPDPYATLARPAYDTPPLDASPPPAPLPPPGAPAALPPSGAPAASAHPPDPPSARDAPSAATLRAALAALDRARAAGYADPVTADPDLWSARSCACRTVDVRRLRALAAAGAALRGHRATLLHVAVARAGPASATLAVTDRLAPYAAVDRAGRVVRRWPGRPPAGWLVTLVREHARWRYAAIARAP